MKKVLIIGYGTVGHNLAAELSALQPDIYDKYKPDENTRLDGERYDVAFVCVDTPYVPGECVCDTREVENAILENDADIFVVKSTVLPRDRGPPGGSHRENRHFLPGVLRRDPALQQLRLPVHDPGRGPGRLL